MKIQYEFLHKGERVIKVKGGKNPRFVKLPAGPVIKVLEGRTIFQLAQGLRRKKNAAWRMAHPHLEWDGSKYWLKPEHKN